MPFCACLRSRPPHIFAGGALRFGFLVRIVAIGGTLRLSHIVDRTYACMGIETDCLCLLTCNLRVIQRTNE